MQHEIVIVGSGNVAKQFGLSLFHAGFRITGIVARNKQKGIVLLPKLGNPPLFPDVTYIKSEPTLLIIAVKDDAIESVANALPKFENCIFAHTSGSIPLSSLGDKPNKAVLYPLQTLNTFEKTPIQRIPLLIEKELNETNKRFFEHVCSTLGVPYFNINSETRLYYHLAAVIMSNFANALWDAGNNILSERNLDSRLLTPLLQQTLANAIQNGAFESQTGPAKRNDTSIISKHLYLLKDKDALQEIYTAMSKMILKRHST